MIRRLTKKALWCLGVVLGKMFTNPTSIGLVNLLLLSNLVICYHDY